MNATLSQPTISTGCQQILDALGVWLQAQNVFVPVGDALFAEDGDIDYARRTVTASHLGTARQFEPRLLRLLAGGPDWVHANLVPLADGRLLVTVAVGAPVGSPRPVLNLSHELGRPVGVDG